MSQIKKYGVGGVGTFRAVKDRHVSKLGCFQPFLPLRPYHLLRCRRSEARTNLGKWRGSKIYGALRKRHGSMAIQSQCWKEKMERKKIRIRSLKLSLLFRFGKRNGAHRALIGKSKVGFKQCRFEARAGNVAVRKQLRITKQQGEFLSFNF